MDKSESLIKSILNLFKDFGYKEPEFIEEEMVSYEVVYEPDTVDAHGQWMSAETIEKGCENFNANLKDGIVKANLFHLGETEAFTIEKTWVHQDLDVVVKDTDQPIKAGSWIAKLKFHDKDVWELKKAGIIQGVSIGGKGYVNETTGEITGLTFDEDLNNE